MLHSLLRRAARHRNRSTSHPKDGEIGIDKGCLVIGQTVNAAELDFENQSPRGMEGWKAGNAE